MKYVICKGDNLELLEALVNKMIGRGYIAQGGICFGGGSYIQAVIKKDK